MGKKLVTDDTVVIQYNNEMWDLKAKMQVNAFVDKFDDPTPHFRITLKHFKTFRTIATIFLYPKGTAYRFAYQLFTKDYLDNLYTLIDYIRKQCEEVYFLGKE